MTNLLSRRASERQAARAPQAPAAPAPAATPEPKRAAQSKEAKLAAIREDAQRRVAAAWTTAKTLLPTQSPKVQQHLAAALVAAPTAILAETLRSTARMAHSARGAAKFAEETGRDLNEFVEDEGLLNKLKNEVLAENKKDDANKVAGAGISPEEAKKQGLPEPPPEHPSLVASKGKSAAPGDDPTNLDNQDDAAPEPDAAGTPEGTPDAPQGEFQDPAPQAPAPGEMGDPGAGVDAPAPANAVGDVAAEGDLLANIENVEREIGEIQSEVEEAGDEALDLAAIFNPEVQADKAQNLANEGEGADIPMDELGGGEDFAPSSMDEMMDAADLGAPEGDMTNPQDFFKGASADPMATLFGKNAAEQADVEEGEMDAHFRTDLAGDSRDAEADNADLLGEVLSSLPQPTMEQKRDVQDKLEEPEAPQAKEAGAKPKSSIKTVGAPAQAKQASAAKLSDEQIAGLLFRD